MAAIHPDFSNFRTADYGLFQCAIQLRLGNNTVIKSWEVFNRCILTQTSKEKQSRDLVNHNLLELPLDNRELQKLLISAFSKVVQARKENAGRGQLILSKTDQIKDAMLELPESSPLRQRLIQELVMKDPITKNYLSQNAEHVRMVEDQIAALSKPIRSKKELDAKEDSIRAMIFSLPYCSSLLQNELREFRVLFEADVQGRLPEFQESCEALLTPDPNEYPGGDTPLEHRATLTYVNHARSDALITISYHRLFANQ